MTAIYVVESIIKKKKECRYTHARTVTSEVHTVHLNVGAEEGRTTGTITKRKGSGGSGEMTGGTETFVGQ